MALSDVQFEIGQIKVDLAEKVRAELHKEGASVETVVATIENALQPLFFSIAAHNLLVSVLMGTLVKSGLMDSNEIASTIEEVQVKSPDMRDFAQYLLAVLGRRN